MTTWHKLSGMAARERQLTMMQRTTDYWQIVSTSHDTHLQSTTTVQTSDLKFNGRLVTPNYPSTAHSTKLDLETRLRAPTGHKPRTSNRVKMSCEKQLTTQIEKKKQAKKLDQDSPRNRHLAIYTTMCLNVAGRLPSDSHNSVSITRFSEKLDASSHVIHQHKIVSMRHRSSHHKTCIHNRRSTKLLDTGSSHTRNT